MSGPKLRLGTRASALARWQAEWVAAELARRAEVAVELVPIASQGDQDQVRPIGALGTQGVFTKALEDALLAGTIDLAVHSLKDLPTEPVAGLVLAAVPARESVADVLLALGERTLAELPPGAVVGTGSLRRRAQLLRARADLDIRDVRGNVDTRLRKLTSGEYAALVLARAGLTRLGRLEHLAEELPSRVMLPAVGQGALGLETRADDQTTRDVLAVLDDAAAHAAVRAERQMLATLRGGCLAPVAGWARPSDEGQLRLNGRVLSPDGQRMVESEATGPADDPEGLGQRVAEHLLAQGASELIAAGRPGEATR